MSDSFTATLDRETMALTFDGPLNPEKFYNFIVSCAAPGPALALDPILFSEWEGHEVEPWPFVWGPDHWYPLNVVLPLTWTVTEANDHPNRSNRRADYEAVHYEGVIE